MKKQILTLGLIALTSITYPGKHKTNQTKNNNRIIRIIKQKDDVDFNDFCKIYSIINSDGFDPNIQDSDGNTILHHFAKKKHGSYKLLIDFLLKKPNIKSNIQNNDGLTYQDIIDIEDDNELGIWLPEIRIF